MATDPQREKRRTILRAAISVFARSGYHTSRVADVATEAGVAYGLVYHYFGSKEELLDTIFRPDLDADARGGARRSSAAICRRGSSSPRWRASSSARGRPIPTSFACSSARSRGARSSDARSTRSSTPSRRSSGSSRAASSAGSSDRELDARFAAWILYGALEEILTGWVYGRLPSGPDEVEEAVRTVVELLFSGLAVESIAVD